jgi:sRNA-binding regulator protein Hfq
LALPPSEEEAKKRAGHGDSGSEDNHGRGSKACRKPLSNGFIPKLKGKKVIIRLTSGGQPVAGTIEGYNPYEILLLTTTGELLVFKHAIATIEETTK